MRAELPRYPVYRPTESEWLGELPQGWQAIQLARINTKLTNGFVGPTRDILRDEGVRYLQSLHIKGGQIIFDTPYFVSPEWSAAHKKAILKTGDVLIVQTGDIGQVAAVTDQFADCSCHALIIVRAKRKMIDGFFLSAVLRSHYGFHSLKSVQTGALHPHLNCTNIRDIFLPIPPLPDQRAILAFLDRETAKIDRLMAVRQKQGECLQEQRTAVIHHAVTKGLDPQAKMKPSGVEWLGEIPFGWQTNRLRFLVKFKGGGTPSKANAEYWTGDIPWVSPKDMRSLEIDDAEDHISTEALADSASSMVEKGSVLIVVRSGILRRCIPVAMNTTEVALNQDMKALQATKIDARFLMFFILGNQDQLLVLWRKQGSTVESLEQPQMGGTYIVLPPANEQEAIVAHIDREAAKIDTLIAKYQRELELLAEYRASLISHAVTGKIDVRGLVEPQSLEAA